MAAIIGHILPIAIGVALSSVPIVVMVLILLSPRGRSSGLAYLIGATLGLAGLTALFSAIASLLPPPPASQKSPTRRRPTRQRRCLLSALRCST